MVKLKMGKKKEKNMKLTASLKKRLKRMPVFQNKFLSRIKNMVSSKVRRRNLTNIIISTSFLLVILAGFFELNSKSELSSLLIYAKDNSEDKFTGILNEIEENPLNDLLGDKLPTTEEIFFAEWANDWFPRIDIPIVGSIIEEFGAQKVGDTDFDGIAPYADLNITSNSNPSNLSLKQCEALWNRKDPYSFLVDWPVLWYDALENDQKSINLLRNHFNLTYTQFDLISTWINTSSSSWMSNIRADVLTIPASSILIALSILAIGAIVCDYLYQKRNFIHNNLKLMYNNLKLKYNTLKLNLETRRAEKRRKAEQKRIEAQKQLEEKIELLSKKLPPPKPPISAVTPEAHEVGGIPSPEVKVPLPFKSSTRRQKQKTSFLQCPKCSTPQVVYYLNISKNAAVLKVTCPTDKIEKVIKLPLENINEWIEEITDQIYRCRICGAKVLKPEKIVLKDPWVVLFIKCPIHGLKAPKRYVFNSLYPEISERSKQISGHSIESKTEKLGGAEN